MCQFKKFKSSECPSYEISELKDGFINLKAACKALNGKMASEDLKDRLLKFSKNNNKKKPI